MIQTRNAVVRFGLFNGTKRKLVLILLVSFSLSIMGCAFHYHEDGDHNDNCSICICVFHQSNQAIQNSHPGLRSIGILSATRLLDFGCFPRWLALFLFACVFAAVFWGFSTGFSTAYAQTDEIVVYDAEINKPGQFSVELHSYYTAVGRKHPDFPGGIVPNHNFNGMLEWVYGVTDWLELGAHSPIYSFTGNGDLLYDASAVRALLVVPNARSRTFFYGIDFELDFNTKHWDQSRVTGEIRPIIGYRIGPVDIILKPIFDTAFDGISSLDFKPAGRAAYNFSETWAGAIELYQNFGRPKELTPIGKENQEFFIVVDYKGEPNGVELGVGHGFNDSSDGLIFKLIISHAF